MIIIPAIDLKAGQVVRLEQGRMDRDKVYSSDPAEVAKKFAAAGAELIHVVDLDGAFQKKPVNHDAIQTILEAARVPIEVGGGVRDFETIAFLPQPGSRPRHPRHRRAPDPGPGAPGRGKIPRQDPGRH